MRTVIVDDEPLARERIRRMLRGDSSVQLVAESSNGKGAVEAIRKHSPDLIFLDVQMPEMDGFQVLESLDQTRLPYVIFVTAYDQYALKAFEVYALDYLLKPFNEERLQKALTRAKQRMQKERGGDLTQGIVALLQELRSKSTSYLARLVIKEEGRAWFIRTDQIDWIGAEGKYVNLHVGKEAHLLREPLTALEARLDPKTFVRIHRSTIVNLNRIKEIQPWFYGEYRILLHNGTVLSLSRTYRKKFQDAIGQP